MELDDYAQAALRTANTALEPRDRLLDAAAGLAEEGGEVLGLVRKHLFFGHPLDRERMAKELGDALWCLAVTAHHAGISLSEVAEANVEKLRLRYPEGFSASRSRERPDGG